MSFQSFGRFLVRANMRRIKKVGRSIMKDLKKEEHGTSTVSNSGVDRSPVVQKKEEPRRVRTRTTGRESSVSQARKKEDPRVIKEQTPQVGRLKSTESNLHPSNYCLDCERHYQPELSEDGTCPHCRLEDPTVHQHIEQELMKGPNIAAELEPEDQRERAYAAIGQLSAVVKKIIYWTDQTQVQEVLWYAIEHEEDRYVCHILETVLAQVERTPEPEV